MIDYDQKFPDIRQTGETELRQAQLVMLRMLCIIDDICRRHGLQYWLCSGTLLGAIRHKGFIPWDDDLDICMPREDYEQFLSIAQTEFPEDMFLQTRETDPLYDYLPLPCKIRDNKSYLLAEGFEKKQYNMGLFVDVFPADKYHLDETTFKKEVRLKNYFTVLCKGYNCELSRRKSLSRRLVYYLNPVFRMLIRKYLKKVRLNIEKNKDLKEDFHVGHGFDTPWTRYFSKEEIYPLRDIEFEGYRFMIPNNANAYLTQLYGSDYMTPPPKPMRTPKHAIKLNASKTLSL